MSVNTPRDGDMVILKGFNRRMMMLTSVQAEQTAFNKLSGYCVWYDDIGRYQSAVIPLEILEVATLN